MCHHHLRFSRRGANGAGSLSRRSFLAALTVLAGAGFSGFSATSAKAERAAKVDLPPPGPDDICPVCGMFVAKYPEWIATVLFKDGHADHFDGAKDFFKYLHDMPKYARGRTADQIAGMGVTDYYGVERIDAKAAFYVIGSDVLGPMGHELIPHATKEEAEEYFADHAGKRLLSYDEVAMPMLVGLDNGKFE
ncbi:MAG: nitrous oxide reductase accessory protein NosL [Hyphomicrobiales bacterium]|nr:MAG: nitrous oxide reductase accessory protein NosL [Hyphomicrobiales bacterium]